MKTYPPALDFWHSLIEVEIFYSLKYLVRNSEYTRTSQIDEIYINRIFKYKINQIPILFIHSNHMLSIGIGTSGSSSSGHGSNGHSSSHLMPLESNGLRSSGLSSVGSSSSGRKKGKNMTGRIDNINLICPVQEFTKNEFWIFTNILTN